MNYDFRWTIFQSVIISIPGLGTGNRHTIPFVGDVCTADYRKVVRNPFFHGPDSFFSIHKARQHINGHRPGVLSSLCHFRTNFRMDGRIEFPDGSIIASRCKGTNLIMVIACVQFQTIHQISRFRTVGCRVAFPVLRKSQEGIVQRIGDIKTIVMVTADHRSIIRYRLRDSPNHRIMGIKRILRQVVICHTPLVCPVSGERDLNDAIDSNAAVGRFGREHKGIA